MYYMSCLHSEYDIGYRETDQTVYFRSSTDSSEGFNTFILMIYKVSYSKWFFVYRIWFSNAGYGSDNICKMSGNFVGYAINYIFIHASKSYWYLKWGLEL